MAAETTKSPLEGKVRKSRRKTKRKCQRKVKKMRLLNKIAYPTHGSYRKNRAKGGEFFSETEGRELP